MEVKTATSRIEKPEVMIDGGYYYKGSSNITLQLREGSEPGEIDLITDYGEKVATVHTINQLQKELTKLLEDKYA